ncbi:T9SS type A sorting domain-containing protein [bacterium]|nr:T9SS type A sorting domain-containing protein [bacterium]MBU1652811.1 T9SS type A sorting domain-containing protein [bacterium]MBU1881316.1 T9SS type A sorting domain-containing protein [bacterium]
MIRNRSLVLALLAALLATQAAQAETHISGALSGTLPADTYIVDAQIYVPAGQTLLIEAGSILRFDGNFGFLVEGTLQAAGIEEDSIVFEPNIGVTSWSGIEFAASSVNTNNLSYSRISGSNNSGIRTTASEIQISNSLIAGNSAANGGGLYGSGTTLYISASAFENNNGTKGGGIYLGNGGLLDVVESNFLYNVALQHGGGIYLFFTNSDVDGCYFEGNRAEDTVRGKGGGLSTENSIVTVVNSIFTQNHSGLSGGGIGLVNDSQGTITRSVFFDNTTSRNGAGLMLKWSVAEVFNCTFDDNAAPDDGPAVFISRDSFINLYNSSITNHSGPSAIFVESTSSGSFSYNNLHGNSGANFGGNIPTGTGQISTVNANGDPADQYYNIFELPDYVDQVNRDYNLLSSSAMIDAGDPNSPSDPDGTIADIGAFYFLQGGPVLSVTLTPQNPPIQIPASGGVFSYDLAIVNSGSDPFNLDLWIMLTLPNGQTSGPIILREDVTIPGNTTISRPDLPYFVAGSMPAGLYHYSAFAGSYPSTIVASDEFTFEKLGNLDSGEIKLLEPSNQGLAEDYQLLSAYPNPFNPATTIRYNLSQAGEVELTVYNAAGQAVNTLVSGYLEAGYHEVQLDATGLAGGVYLAELQAGERRQVQRLILLK